MAHNSLAYIRVNRGKWSAMSETTGIFPLSAYGKISVSLHHGAAPMLYHFIHVRRILLVLVLAVNGSV